MKDSSDKPVATDTRLKSRPLVRLTLIFKFRQEQNVSGFYILGRWIVKKTNSGWIQNTGHISGVSIYSSFNFFFW